MTNARNGSGPFQKVLGSEAQGNMSTVSYLEGLVELLRD